MDSAGLKGVQGGMRLIIEIPGRFDHVWDTQRSSLPRLS